jgi:hypothetical protein
MKCRFGYRVLAAAAGLAAGCASTQEPSSFSHPVDAVQKVIESLGSEVVQRLEAAPFRNLPVVVRTTATTGTGVEPMVAELLRTRLVERGIAVEAACAARCMEVTLQELSIASPRASGLTPGQVLTVAAGNIPVLGGLVRSLDEQAREKEQAAARASGFLVTFAAREADRYVARENIVAILSSGDGNVALQKR